MGLLWYRATLLWRYRGWVCRSNKNRYKLSGKPGFSSGWIVIWIIIQKIIHKIQMKSSLWKVLQWIILTFIVYCLAQSLMNNVFKFQGWMLRNWDNNSPPIYISFGIPVNILSKSSFFLFYIFTTISTFSETTLIS